MGGSQTSLPRRSVKKNILGTVTLLETWPQTLHWAIVNVILRTDSLKKKNLKITFIQMGLKTWDLNRDKLKAIFFS